MTDDFKKGFFTTLVILKDYIPDIVIAGGWAPFIYYHFDILANCQKLMSSVFNELKNFNKNYPKNWFRRFISNMKTYFADETSKGIDLIISQRPETAFPNMNEEQFKHYVVGVFQEFMNKISSVPQ